MSRTPHVPDFPQGLKLIHIFDKTANATESPLNGPMIVNETIRVPDNTQAVHISVVGAKVHAPDGPVSLESLSFEILVHPIPLTSPRQLHYEFKVFPAWDPNVAWKGSFKLEFMCFG
jgi:hypothetical protein